MTPRGNDRPEITKIRGSTYSIIFCWRYIGDSLVSGDMFLATSCSCVTNCDAVITTIMKPAMTRTSHPEAFVKVSCRGAPKSDALPNDAARSFVSRPMPVLLICASCSTEYSEKKIGICSSSGRQELSGLVPVSLYSAMVSRDMASRENWSFLPLYLSWIFFSCGATSSMRRCDLIWRTKIGISAARTTKVRKMIDSTQVMPALGSMPRFSKTQWKPTRMAETTHLRGQRIVPMRSMRTVTPFECAGGAASGGPS